MKDHSCAWIAMPLTAMALALAGCSKSQPSSHPDAAATQPAAAAGTFTLSSPAFAQGKPIPAKYTDDGGAISPPLKWAGAPSGTKEFALIVEDADCGDNTHWMVYKIPADVMELKEGFSSSPIKGAPSVILQGSGGYIGMSPPAGDTHRYFFRLYALKTALPLKAGMEKDELLAAIKGQTIAMAELMGTYTGTK